MTLLLLLLAFLLTTPASNSYVNIDGDSNNIEVAIEEMQRANYFSFVMLLRMAPPEVVMMLEGGNLTFLMPNDKTLSRNGSIIHLAPPNHTHTHSHSVADFLLRHSIPSPLLFEHLQHFPTGSTVPTSEPDPVVLRITNHGRRGFFLNNVRISSPNICTRGPSIRCHGIDGVIQGPPADHDCRRPNTNNNATSPPPAQPPAQEEDDGTGTTASSSTAPPPGEADSKNGAPSRRILELEMCCGGIFEYATKCLALLVLNLVVYVH